MVCKRNLIIPFTRPIPSISHLILEVSGQIKLLLNMVIAGGVIPQQDYDFLYKAGVSGVFGPGTIISKSAIDILEKLIKRIED